MVALSYRFVPWFGFCWAEREVVTRRVGDRVVLGPIGTVIAAITASRRLMRKKRPVPAQGCGPALVTVHSAV